MIRLCFTHPFPERKLFPSERRPGGLFAPARGKTSPSRLRRATARVAAPSVCYAVACILLAAAPTAPPCFRRWRRSSPLLLSRGGLGIPESFPSSPEAPLLGELSAKQTERLYEGKPDRERKPLPRGEPFQLHDTAPLRWNKWRSSYKLNDTSLNISCSPTWRSSPDWRSTYFASWAQVRHLGEVCFMALVR